MIRFRAACVFARAGFASPWDIPLRCFYVIAAIALSSPAFIFAKEKTATESVVIVATGRAEIQRGDVDAAREAAKQAALVAAVEQGIGYYVTSHTQTENYAVIHSRIVADAGGLAVIRNTVAETREGEILKLTLEVAVSPMPLMHLIRQNGMLRSWRVMIVIPEIHLRSPAPDPAGETEFIRQFAEAGFKTIDPEVYASLRRNDKTITTSLAAAKKIALKAGADIIILGEAFSERAADASGGLASGMVGCNARIEAKAILVDTGEIIHADGVNSRVPTLHTSEVLAGKKAIQSAAVELAEKFVAKLVLRLASLKRPATLFVSGVPDAATARAFEKAAAKLPQTRRVRREDFSQDMLVLEADIAGDDIARVAEQAEKIQLPGFRVKLTATSRHLMRFVLVPQ